MWRHQIVRAQGQQNVRFFARFRTFNPCNRCDRLSEKFRRASSLLQSVVVAHVRVIGPVAQYLWVTTSTPFGSHGVFSQDGGRESSTFRRPDAIHRARASAPTAIWRTAHFEHNQPASQQSGPSNGRIGLLHFMNEFDPAKRQSCNCRSPPGNAAPSRSDRWYSQSFLRNGEGELRHSERLELYQVDEAAASQSQSDRYLSR